MMKGIRWRPGGLSWRLAMSYLLVTLIAALTLGITLTLVQFVHETQQSGASSLASALGKQNIAEVAPYLELTTPDPEALRYWLTFEVITRNAQGIQLVVVLDHQHRVMGSASCDQSELLSSGSKDCAATAASRTSTYLAQPQIRATIQRVMDSPGEAAGITSDGKNFIVAAVPGQTKQVIGELVAIFSGPASAQATTGPGALLVSFWNFWQPADISFLLLAVLLGTVAGILISRNLVRRLNRIARAASAWSRGEFQVVIQDRSRDELGQLAGNLNSMAEQLKSLLSARQALAVVEERNRLARELHDSVKQHMFTSALLMRAARKLFPRDPEGAQQHLIQAEELSEQAQQELSAAIQALRPAVLEDLGLAMVLQDYANDWSQRVGIVVDVRVQGERTTPLQIEEALFRVSQEALSNAARHSRAREVKIQLTWYEEHVGLSMRDNGQGFDTARTIGTGLGLTIMRERVEALHGRLSISSSIEGTTVEADIPLVPVDHRTKAEGSHE
jgi:two-component system, NarL family, sensor histidine kinase LiaS